MKHFHSPPDPGNQGAAFWACLVLFTFSLAPAHAAVAGGEIDRAACARLQSLKLPNVELTSLNQAAGPLSLPAHCLVTGVIEKRVGVGGKQYGIQFEMRLPADWNGRLLFQGGGGTNGVVRPAVGDVKGPAALTRGFAVVSQDAGHAGPDVDFGADQQARIDMEYRSYDRVTVLAKTLVAAYYGSPPAHSYFMGCSEGGREALLVAQRQPLDFDGVVVGDPGFLLGTTFPWVADRQTITALAPKDEHGAPMLEKTFSADDLQLLSQTILGECDAADGLADGLIDSPQSCHPRLEKLVCKSSGHKTSGCLSGRQIKVLRTIFDGGRPVGAAQISRGYFYDTGVTAPAWRGKLAGTGGLVLPGVNSTQGLFSTPYDPTYDEAAMDFKTDAARFAEVGALNRTDGVMLSSFTHHGGKMLLYTGLADPAFSAKDLIAYFQKLAEANGGSVTAAADFARLFLVPGMTHCRGGSSLDDFDPLQTVVDWAEHGKAPQFMVATGKSFPGRSRPLCAYPAQSRYGGAGSIEDAANFKCRVPQATGSSGER